MGVAVTQTDLAVGQIRPRDGRKDMPRLNGHADLSTSTTSSWDMRRST